MKHALRTMYGLRSQSANIYIVIYCMYNNCSKMTCRSQHVAMYSKGLIVILKKQLCRWQDAVNG